ncbi:hypothetical protein GYMC10_3619 [Paenibacillus sp. Y412MC10]|nr:hypothetical protein GYMC10_3619 [Paenibacillus sp. Y412MC10]ETT67099.1 hypothetical protein C172_08424 [Paenibacillus sp. FSL H8-457]
MLENAPNGAHEDRGSVITPKWKPNKEIVRTADSLLAGIGMILDSCRFLLN